MQAGQTLIGTNGKEVLLFPSPIMSITQTWGANTYSHCCGYPIDYAFGHLQPVYAPCTCRKIYDGAIPNGHMQIFTSVDVVNYATGVGYVTFGFAHDWTNQHRVGDVIKQGQLLGYSGEAGLSAGEHTHLEVSIGANQVFTGSGITCSAGNSCWHISNPAQPQHMFFVNDTTVVSSAGLIFKKYEGGVPGPGPDPEPTPSGKSKGMPLFMYLKQL